MITFSRIVYGMRTISLSNVEKPTDNKMSRCFATDADRQWRSVVIGPANEGSISDKVIVLGGRDGE